MNIKIRELEATNQQLMKELQELRPELLSLHQFKNKINSDLNRQAAITIKNPNIAQYIEDKVK